VVGTSFIEEASIIFTRAGVADVAITPKHLNLNAVISNQEFIDLALVTITKVTTIRLVVVPEDGLGEVLSKEGSLLNNKGLTNIILQVELEEGSNHQLGVASYKEEGINTRHNNQQVLVAYRINISS
jgi:hypothetical protein